MRVRTKELKKYGKRMEDWNEVILEKLEKVDDELSERLFGN